MDGELWLPMMSTSTKARDLERDARIVMHSIITGPQPVAQHPIITGPQPVAQRPPGRQRGGQLAG
jgi:hypothetical protein